MKPVAITICMKAKKKLPKDSSGTEGRLDLSYITMNYDTLKLSLTSRLTLIGDHTLSGTPGTSVAVQLPPSNPL